jgi:hypothetical protein
MTQTALRLAFLGVVLAFFGATGVATAEEGRKDCSPIGTWLQVNPDTHVLAGFLSTTEGKSSDGGTLTIENPGFGITLGGLFPTAVKGSTDRGAWKRTGGKTMEFSVIGTAVDSDSAIVWIRKISGTATILDDCKTERITAVMEVYLPTDNPFEGTPLFVVDFGELYAYRVTVP